MEDLFSNVIKRSLELRKFNAHLCNTCELGNGCPFFRTNSIFDWTCALYRVTPGFSKTGQGYVRVPPCSNDVTPPVKSVYTVGSSKGDVDVIAISIEDAMNIYAREHGGGVKNIVKGVDIGYEYLSGWA